MFHSTCQAAIIPAHQAQYSILDPGALIPPPVLQQLQDMVRREARENPNNTLNEIKQQLATIIQNQQEATRRMDHLQEGILGLLKLFAPASALLEKFEEGQARPQEPNQPPRPQRHHPYKMRNKP
jgi:hypothetical protein